MVGRAITLKTLHTTWLDVSLTSNGGKDEDGKVDEYDDKLVEHNKDVLLFLSMACGYCIAEDSTMVVGWFFVAHAGFHLKRQEQQGFLNQHHLSRGEHKQQQQVVLVLNYFGIYACNMLHDI